MRVGEKPKKYPKPKPGETLVGQTFGSWHILSAASRSRRSAYTCEAVCLKCGTKHNVSIADIKNGKSRQCFSCSKKASAQQRSIAVLGRVPDSLDKRLIERRRCFMSRCSNPKHPNFPVYGGRGIKVSEEFKHSPKAFVDYMRSLPNASEHLTIDRIDPDKGYERGNLRWATRKQQSRNLRTVIKHEGVSLRDIADELLPQYESEYVSKWVAQGKQLEQLLNKPYKGWKLSNVPLLFRGKITTPCRFWESHPVCNQPLIVKLARMGLSGEQILAWVSENKSNGRLRHPELRTPLPIPDNAQHSS